MGISPWKNLTSARECDYLRKSKKSKIVSQSRLWHNMSMTEKQRDYVADLALKKGVILEDTSNVSASWASAKIEELKSLPDKDFSEPSPEFIKSINDSIGKINKGIQSWILE